LSYHPIFYIQSYILGIHNSQFAMVFLTGGTGLLGQYILQKLTDSGYKVRALCRHLEAVPLHLKSKAEWVEGDLLDVPCLETYMEGCAYVVHGAGKVSYHSSDKKELYTTNVEGTANMVNVALAYPIRKFLFISSIAALGRNKDKLIVDENAQWQENELNTYYAKTKYLAELEVWRGIAEGLPAVAVHPAVVLGAGDWTQSSTQIFQYIWKEKPYYPQGQLSYVDVRDVADIVARLLPTDLTAERFVVSAGEVMYLDLFTQIAHKFKKKPAYRPITPFLGEIAWRLAYLQSFFTGKKPLISRETVRLGRNNFIYVHDKIATALDFSFRTLEETIEWTCAELSKKG